MQHLLITLASLPFFLLCIVAPTLSDTNASSPDSNAKVTKSKFVIGLQSTSSDPKDENVTVFTTPGGDVIVPIQNEFDAYGWSDKEERAGEVAAIMKSCIPKALLSVVKVEIKSDFDVNGAIINTWYPEGTVNISANSAAVPFEKLKEYLSNCSHK